MICRNNPKRKYTGNEPSPKGLGWCASTEKLGKKRKGKDDNIWIARKVANGSRRWFKYKNDEAYKKIKAATKGAKKYFIHYNGAMPFLTYIRKNTVWIYMRDRDDYQNWSDDMGKNAWMYIMLIKKYRAIKIFIGKSLKCEMTKFSGEYGRMFDGNSILIQTARGRYVYIGKVIYEFSTNDIIEKYYSPIGNSDVPYPVAYGKQNAYFMSGRDYISYDKAPMLASKNEIDAYDYYYGSNNQKGSTPLEKYTKRMKSIKQIQKRQF